MCLRYMKVMVLVVLCVFNFSSGLFSADDSSFALLEKWTFNLPPKDNDIFVSEGKWKSDVKMFNYSQVKTPGTMGIEFDRTKPTFGFCPGTVNWSGKDGPGILSIEAWIKLYKPALKKSTVIVAKWQGGLFLRLWEGEIMCRYNNTNYKLEADKWYHIVYTVKSLEDRPGAMENFYINGESVHSKKIYDFDWGLADTYLCIGTLVPDIGLFDGIIDEIRIWQKELSAAEVQASYKTGPTVSQ